MRLLPQNVIVLCSACHLYWWHLHPVAAKEWIDQYLGTEHMDSLRSISEPPQPVNRIFLDQMEINLKEYESQITEDGNE